MYFCTMLQNSNLAMFLTSNLKLEKEETDLLISGCKEKSVTAGDYLLRQGESCRHVFYVEKGLLRKYGIDDKGKEHILQFGPENWFVTDRESSILGHPSLFFIQALEDTRVRMLDELFIRELSKKVEGFSAFNNRLLHNHIHQLTKRIYGLLSDTAEERYLAFIKTYPDILLRVPQWMVASYLGITPESLSRVRKDLASRNFRK